MARLTEAQRRILDWMAENPAEHTLDSVRFEHHYGGRTLYSRFVNCHCVHVQPKTALALLPYLETQYVRDSNGVRTVIYRLIRVGE